MGPHRPSRRAAFSAARSTARLPAHDRLRLRHAAARRLHRRRPWSQARRASLSLSAPSPFAHDAIEALPDGRVRIHFSRSTRNGACFTTITRDAFLVRLAALVPAPRFNLVRYYGVLASRHHLRERVAPKSEPLDRAPHQLPLSVLHTDADLAAFTTAVRTIGDPRGPPRPRPDPPGQTLLFQ